MGLKIYDANEIMINFAGQPLDGGFADGEFVRIEGEDFFTDVAGTDGEVSRSKSNDKRATITVLLMQTSDGNDVLNAIHEADRIAPNGAGVAPLVVKDLQGNSLHLAPEAWITKKPDVSYDREATPREWVFRCAELENHVGGN